LRNTDFIYYFKITVRRHNQKGTALKLAYFNYAFITGTAEAYPVLAEPIYTSQRREMNTLQKSLEIPHGFTTQMQHIFKPQALVCFWATYHFQMEVMNKSDRNKLSETGNYKKQNGRERAGRKNNPVQCHTTVS